ncbi:hypothetical protein ULMA_22790 [Patiriisocius marinus]|uniref:asparagine synthase (glutamine-hydrolyzing) n=1 Tax=Patiriisocius marinus TaxID=1397112 RepID=A0A5J4J2Z8_9FLAO|nr:asparagine synthase [Patiriisocius marinus]GER60171.1 hypothetical protein ULMA_22790 [Patiriisocius marinus]
MGRFVFSYGNIEVNKKTILLDSSISNDNFFIGRENPQKFKNDKIFEENENFIILIDGVILNIKELKFNKNDFFNQIIALYELEGDFFFEKFRGPFSGVFYDKKAKKWILFTDHTGSKIIYYSRLETNKLIASSSLQDLLKIRVGSKLDNTINENSAYMLLSYGFLVSENTLINGVNKILPGQCIVIQDDSIDLKQFYKFNNKENHSLTDTEIIENVDLLFKKAIHRQFEKDKEYGYNHLVGLSGGLDSRMTTVVANDVGYKNQINYTFSQTDYLDETIPKKIAETLRHEWLFKSLDNGIFMKKLDEVSAITEGNVNYYGVAHGHSMLKLINFNSLGIIHTGQLGDVILGTFSSSKSHKKTFNISGGAFSKKYVSKIDFSNIKMKFDNEEMFKLYLRGFSATNAGLLGIQHFSETMSPFYDIDFMEYCFSIPANKRYGHKIYKKWLNQKHPIASNFIWEKTRSKPKNKKFNFTFKYKGRIISLNTVLFKLKILKYGLDNRYHMNPLQYWINNNEDLRVYLDNYYSENIVDTNLSMELEKDIRDLYNSGNIMEKGLVLSLLSFIKLNKTIQ